MRSLALTEFQVSIVLANSFTGFVAKLLTLLLAALGAGFKDRMCAQKSVYMSIPSFYPAYTRFLTRECGFRGFYLTRLMYTFYPALRHFKIMLGEVAYKVFFEVAVRNARVYKYRPYPNACVYMLTPYLPLGYAQRVRL